MAILPCHGPPTWSKSIFPLPNPIPEREERTKQIVYDIAPSVRIDSIRRADQAPIPFAVSSLQEISLKEFT